MCIIHPPQKNRHTFSHTHIIQKQTERERRERKQFGGEMNEMMFERERDRRFKPK